MQDNTNMTRINMLWTRQILLYACMYKEEIHTYTGIQCIKQVSLNVALMKDG